MSILRIFRVSFMLLATIFIILPAYSQWEWKDPLPQGISMQSLWFTNSSTGYLAGGSTIMKTTNSGESWEINYVFRNGENKNNYFESICFPDENNGYVAGCSAIYKTSNAGASWDLSFTNPQSCLNDVYFVDSLNGYAVGWDGEVLKTTDGGSSWQSQSITPWELTSVWFPTHDTGFAADEGGSIYRTINAGETWTDNFGTFESDIDIQFSDKLNGCFSVDQYLGYTSDGGRSWNYFAFNLITSFCMIDKHNIIVATRNYNVWPNDVKIQKTVDGGLHWTSINIPYHYQMDHMYGTPQGIVYCTGLNGFIARSTDYGVTWTQLSQSLTDDFSYMPYNDVDFPTLQTGYAVAAGDYYYSAVVKTTDGGNSWFRLDSTLSNSFLQVVRFLNADTGYIGGMNLYITLDGGTSWIKKWQGSNSSMITSIDFASHSSAIAVGYPDIFLRTTDQGQQWNQVNGIPSGRFKCVNFADELTGYASAENLLLKTVDGGEHWFEIPTNFTFSIMDFVSDQIGYGLNSDYKIMKTTDGGLSWNLLSVNLPYHYFSAMDFYDQDTGFIAGSILGTGDHLFKTTDGGLTFIEQYYPIWRPNTIHIKEDYTMFAAINGGLLTNMHPGIVLNSYTLPVDKSRFNIHTFPNPANESITIQYELPDESPVTFRIYSINGLGLKTITDKSNSPGTYKFSLSISDLSPGIYIVRMISGKYSGAQKIVVY